MNDQAAASQSTHRAFVIGIASIAALAGMLFGYDTGVISGAILFIKPEFNLTLGQTETIVSIAIFGALCGAIFSGRLTDRFGRRGVLIGTAIIFAVGALGSAFSHSASVLTVYRFLLGVGIGVASFTAPLYLSEISPKKMRGALVSLNQLMITIGIMLAYFVNFGFFNIR